MINENGREEVKQHNSAFHITLHATQITRKMKTAVFAFFGLVATALSAKIELESVQGVLAKGMGPVTAGAVSDDKSGAASGGVDGDGAVLGMAQVGSAIAGALSSPYL